MVIENEYWDDFVDGNKKCLCRNVYDRAEILQHLRERGYNVPSSVTKMISDTSDDPDYLVVGVNHEYSCFDAWHKNFIQDGLCGDGEWFDSSRILCDDKSASITADIAGLLEMVFGETEVTS